MEARMLSTDVFKLCLKVFICSSLGVFSMDGFSQEASSVTRLKKLTVEELMNIEVMSVSNRPEKLTEVASAIQIITAEDIRRSGVTRLPEALRLVSNLQISQANSHDWAITARGFNGLPSAGGVLANKLLVMIDGRSIYNPLFGGVYWDIQNVLLEDIDHIEVVSGPGGTLWGANAVNGVINIVTKSAKETQGLYISAAAGTLLKDQVSARYGATLNPNLFLRVYAQRMDQRNTELDGDKTAHDQWHNTQAGFRLDYNPSTANTITIQGDTYYGEANDSISYTVTDGQNLMTLFTHTFSPLSNLTVRGYFDRTWRRRPNNVANPFFYELYTHDWDFQYRFPVGANQSVLVGANYRFQRDQVVRGLTPLSRDMPLYSGFVQDEIDLANKLLKLTLGSKFLHNVFSGFEVQPNARIAFTPNDVHTVWAAASRAVRIPTRFDSDVTITPIKFDSEKIAAYELGYRIRPLETLSISLATFFNHYNDLRSLDESEPPAPPIVLANSQTAESWGVELSANFQAATWWRLRGGYTNFHKSIWAASDLVLPVSKEFEGVDPKNQLMIQSIMDFPRNFQLDLVGRYVDDLSAVPAANVMAVESYFTFDVRVAWQFKSSELSIVGQNLIDDQHTEVGLSKIPRSIYGKITCRF
jgi:iron complex outermembrane recepter protein